MQTRHASGAVLLLIGLGCLVSGATAAPTSFTLDFNGVHVIDASLPAGIRHEGRFTASGPLCPAGRAADVRDIQIEPLTVMRTYTCDDGTGSFTALLETVAGEHGGLGPWKIVEGTGRYATLRGMGTYTGHILSGDPGRFETIVYSAKWQGVVDFDAVGPTVDLTARASKLKRPPRTYSIRLALEARDDVPGNSVAYSIDVRAGNSFLAFKQGTTSSGQAIVNLRLRVPRGVRGVQIILTATDPVGNQTSSTRSLGLG